MQGEDSAESQVKRRNMDDQRLNSPSSCESVTGNQADGGYVDRSEGGDAVF
jgi:hypothetical protein